MKFIQIVRTSLRSISSNKLRMLLTMLGLVIGISSVIILVGVSEGSNKQIDEKVKALGGNILAVDLFNDGISLNDYNNISKIDGIKTAAPIKYLSRQVNNGRKTSMRSMIIATNQNYTNVQNVQLQEGRQLSDIDIENKNKVCLIGSSLSAELFGNKNAVGETVTLEGVPYTVVGILQQQGQSRGIDVDNLVLIPLSTVPYLGDNSQILGISLKAKDEKLVPALKQRIRNYLMSDLSIDGAQFNISSQDEMMDTGKEINQTLSLLLGGIAGISLLVGGIGVMNVMLVSVAERVKEIGVRKALGAKRSDILFQFLIEALVISVIGGVLGIVVGIVLGELSISIGFAFIVSQPIIYISFLASMAIGLGFGIFPAYRASRLNPIDALRKR